MVNMIGRIAFSHYILLLNDKDLNEYALNGSRGMIRIHFIKNGNRIQYKEAFNKECRVNVTNNRNGFLVEFIIVNEGVKEAICNGLFGKKKIKEIPNIIFSSKKSKKGVEHGLKIDNKTIYLKFNGGIYEKIRNK